MFLKRRSLVFPACILIYLAYRFFPSLPSGVVRDNRQAKEPSTASQTPAKQDTIHWTRHAERYPVSSFISLPTGTPSPIPRIQHDFDAETHTHRKARLHQRDKVKEAFLHSWKGYRRHAWLRDELSPISGGYRDAFGGWAASLIDSLDTLWIMDLKDEFEDALAALELIDFSTTDQAQINVFETTIRYIGGFLGAYDLTEQKYPILLSKATEIADMLYGAFDTPNRMPQARWQWTRSAEGLPVIPSRNTILAELGSLDLEFTRLSQLTGDPKYFDATQRITTHLEVAQNESWVTGLWPVMVNAERLEFVDHRFTVGGMADSTYEYLPKEHLLLGGCTDQYRNMYESAIEAIKKHLLFRAMTEDGRDIVFAGNGWADSNSIVLEHQVEHLKCYLGGTVAIGAKIFERPDELAIARKLVDGCIWAYDVMPTGIMPEVFHVSACGSMEHCPWNKEQWHRDVHRRLASTSAIDDAERIVQEYGLQPGVSDIPDARYILRPEAIESVFILYRITGDQTLRDAAWRMFQNIDKHTRTTHGHASVADVRAADAPNEDYMESFWLAETLKYFYLIFSEPSLVSLDDYVLNTEAHPFKRPVPSSVP